MGAQWPSSSEPAQDLAPFECCSAQGLGLASVCSGLDGGCPAHSCAGERLLAKFKPPSSFGIGRLGRLEY